MADVDMSAAKELANNLPDEIKIAVERFGFAKLAAAVYGVEEINEKTAAEIIGTKLAQRLAANREIKLGIQALGELAR